jgi:hypothetical protein
MYWCCKHKKNQQILLLVLNVAFFALVRRRANISVIPEIPFNPAIPAFRSFCLSGHSGFQVILASGSPSHLGFPVLPVIPDQPIKHEAVNYLQYVAYSL